MVMEPLERATTFTASYPLEGVVGDFNGDGKLDIVTVSDPDYGNLVQILLGQWGWNVPASRDHWELQSAVECDGPGL